MRTIACSTSPVLVSQTNYTRIGIDRCTTHSKNSVDHTVVELHMLELDMLWLMQSHGTGIVCKRLY